MAVSFSAKKPAIVSVMPRAVEMSGFSDSWYTLLALKSFCRTELVSRKSLQASFHAASLWSVTLVPALRTG